MLVFLKMSIMAYDKQLHAGWWEFLNEINLDHVFYAYLMRKTNSVE